MNNRKPRHFDPLRNRLPQNWTNENATKYYNRCWWKKCKCELRINTNDPCCAGDKWDPCGGCDSKWTQGCNPCSDFHRKDKKFHHTYNHKDCGCSEAGPNNPDCKCSNNYTDECDDDVVVRFVANNAEISCSNLVELKFPVGGSKERYLAQFSEEFVRNNRFQCAIPAVFNDCPGNVIDNRREEEFTESDERALVSRYIRNKFLAERVSTRKKHKHSIPSNVASNGTYYYLGGPGNRSGSTQTGLYGPHVTGKSYFADCDC